MSQVENLLPRTAERQYPRGWQRCLVGLLSNALAEVDASFLVCCGLDEARRKFFKEVSRPNFPSANGLAKWHKHEVIADSRIMLYPH